MAGGYTAMVGEIDIWRGAKQIVALPRVLLVWTASASSIIEKVNRGKQALESQHYRRLPQRLR